MIKKFRNYEPVIGENTWVADSAEVFGWIELGDEVSIWNGTVLRGDVNLIKIGSRSNIQDLSMLHTSEAIPEKNDPGFPLIIGEDVTVGHKVMLHGCTIGNGCLIGMSATILDGAEIGEGSIVAAGSVVPPNKKFPPHCMIMGAPAKVKRELSQEEVDGFIAHAKHYVEYKNLYIEEEINQEEISK